MSWNKSALGDVAKVISGYAFKSKDFKSDNGIPVIKIKNIRRENVDFSEEYYVSDSFLSLNEKYHVKRSDILISLTGSHITLPNSVVGRVAMYNFDVISLLNQRAGKIIVEDEGVLDKKFLYYYLCSEDVRTEIAMFGHGGANQCNISPKNVESIEVPLPALKTQKKIASILSAYDELIENNLKRIKLLEEAAQQIYKEWFVHFRFPAYETAEFVDGLPVGWERVTVFDVAAILSGGTPKTTIAEYWNGEIPFFTPKDASSNGHLYIKNTEKYITEEGLKKCNSKLYAKNTVFITARGTVGKICMAMESMAMNQSCYALQGKDSVPQFFLCSALRDGVAQLKKSASGGVFDTIIVDTFKRIPFIKPTEKLMNEFESLVRPILKQTETLQKEVHCLKEARDLLLPRLMNRTIEV